MVVKLDGQQIKKVHQVPISQRKAAQVSSPIERLNDKNVIISITTSPGGHDKPFFQPPCQVMNPAINPGRWQAFPIFPLDNNDSPIGAGRGSFRSNRTNCNRGAKVPTLRLDKNYTSKYCPI
eukprot:1999637-Ditylum_brightwellii.AAC.2